ncbi:MAG TPA: YfbR-like 5'-deoxynucleotidase [Bacillota bacterium]
MDGIQRFLVAAHQMNVIERWNNKPNLLTETVAAHSYLVAVIGWGLSAAAGARGGEPVDAVEVIKRAVAHDLHEVITGDILAPTKRSARTFKRAVEQLEHQAGLELVGMLPPALRPRFERYIVAPMDESVEGRLVETADLFAASLKAWLEVQMGNGFHRGNLARIRSLLQALPSADVHELMWELEVSGDTLEQRPSLAKFLRLLFTLYYVKRWNNLPTLAPKSVAAHGHLVALIAWVLAEAENAQRGANLPVGDILRRALLLEAPKAITGDILYVSKTASPGMERGVEQARTRASRELLGMLPPHLQPAFAPFLEPLGGEAEQLVQDASRLAGYLEAAMEVRLGNGYFQPILDVLRERVESPFAATRAVMQALDL